jgi:beta-glucosidase/6-phospho-beta-glucosidase/beta-galactosidase
MTSFAPTRYFSWFWRIADFLLQEVSSNQMLRFNWQVRWWITINEPVIISLGYAETKGHAPNVNQPGIADYLAARTMLLAHARAYHVYYQEFNGTQEGKS